VSEAETLARSLNFNFIAVISGVGVREYWKNLGYSLEGNGEYMIKLIG
jgi:elongator complex protein 3